ncbi:hypothetical protein LCGC14_1654270 [marine sediment metagenome]|uniref:Uncharacterized protein n=1 Tax=marine sediment metagenome TaxID=412755 RepID=A0A0F9IIK4_9ZZZZ
MLDSISDTYDSYIDELSAGRSDFPSWASSPAEEMGQREAAEGVRAKPSPEPHYEPFGVNWIIPPEPISYFEKAFLVWSHVANIISKGVAYIQRAFDERFPI